MIDKKLANEYGMLANVCKCLKPHASLALFLDDHVIALESHQDMMLCYAVAAPDVHYDSFVHTLHNIIKNTSYNTKYRKTKSDISWTMHDGKRYVTITNPNMDPLDIPIVNQVPVRERYFATIYGRIYELGLEDFWLKDLPDSMFTQIPQQFIDDMNDKKMCTLNFGPGRTSIVSRPFLGDLKKTEYLGYTMLDEDDPNLDSPRFRVLFKQREAYCDIYTLAAFLILK